MNSYPIPNLHESRQEKADLTQSQFVNTHDEERQTETCQSLDNQAELNYLHTLYESLPCICLTLNAKGVILSVSQFGAAYLSFDPLDLVKQLVECIVYVEDRDNFQSQLIGLKPRQLSEWEARIIDKNGKIIWVKAIARLVPNTESNPIILLVCEDTTELKQMEEKQRDSQELPRSKFSNTSEKAFTRDNTDITNLTNHQRTEVALRDSEERFRVTFEQAAVGISHCDLKGRFLRVNQKFCEILGYASEELLTRTFRDITFPDDIEFSIDGVRSLLAGKTAHYSLEKRYVRKDGTILWGHQTVSLVSEPTGEPKHFVAVLEDISDRKLAEEKLLHKSEALANFSSNLKELHRLNTTRYNSFEPLFSDYLKTGCEILQLPIGIVNQLDGHSCIIRSVQSDIGWLVPGLELELKDIYCAAVVQEQKTIAYNHVGAIESLRNYPLYQNLNLESYIGTPIFVNSQVYGTINFSSTQVRSPKFEAYEQEVIELMAQSIGIFIGAYQAEIERQQAEEALRQQFLREQLVGAIAQRIHQSLNLEEILNTTVAEVRQFLVCDRVVIFRLNGDGSGVVVVESVDSNWIPITGTVINDRYFAQSYVQLYQQGRVQAVEDIYNAGLTQCHVDLLAQFQARANLVVPIVQEEKLWGLLVAQQCGETRKWQPLDIDLLKSLSTQTGIAIHQSELYQQAQTEIIQRQQAEAALQQQFQREKLVGAIAQRIRKSLNLDTILTSTVAEVRQVLATDRVIIFRFEPDWSGNIVVESVDSPWDSILGTNIYDPCFEEMYVLPYQQGRVKAIEDIYKAKLGQCHLDLLVRFQVRANLVVPILNGEKLWGLLIAHHCSEPRHWQPYEIDLLCSLASQVAIAIQQSELYQQAQSLAKREQALNQVTQAIRSSLDLNTIFSTTVREIGELLQVDRAYIVQYLPEQKRWLHVSEYGKYPNLPEIGREIPDENNPIAERLKSLEVVRIDDTQTFEDEVNKGLAQAFPGAWLLVPLQFGSKIWGSITLGKDNEPYRWQDSEVELICAVADQVAIAIQQAELYKQSCTATAQAVSQAQQRELALQELQTAQAQLVQSEKMSSLGQLVAGVAHEINNPVNFIYANLTYASEYTQDLLGLIELYQQQYPNPTSDILAEIEAIELEFLSEDLPKLLASMKVGAERIYEIVRSLRNFSRLAEAEIKAVDIHEGLDSTLVILQNRLRPVHGHPGAEVIKKYGNLPKVECFAGQLNQVFMNLLTNAVDALDERDQIRTLEEIEANPSIIRIHTELLKDDHVVIRIADNGPGMTPQVKQRLFDPFFTTKPVGVGTGLGLSISYQIIVEKHRGQLQCLSELEQGTEFIIQIPLRQLSEG